MEMRLPLDEYLPKLKTLKHQYNHYEHDVEEVIIAIESSEHDFLNEIIYDLVNKIYTLRLLRYL